MIKGTAADLENLSMQSISGLLTKEVAYITGKGEVRTGIVMSVAVDCDGICSVKISKNGSGGGTAISMEMVFTEYDQALEEAILIAEEERKNLADKIAAMRGQIDNIRNNPETN